MQTNPAVEQNKNIKLSESPWPLLQTHAQHLPCFISGRKSDVALWHSAYKFLHNGDYFLSTKAQLKPCTCAESARFLFSVGNIYVGFEFSSPIFCNKEEILPIGEQMKLLLVKKNFTVYAQNSPYDLFRSKIWCQIRFRSAWQISYTKKFRRFYSKTSKVILPTFIIFCIQLETLVIIFILHYIWNHSDDQISGNF